MKTIQDKIEEAAIKYHKLAFKGMPNKWPHAQDIFKSGATFAIPLAREQGFKEGFAKAVCLLSDPKFTFEDFEQEGIRLGILKEK